MAAALWLAAPASALTTHVFSTSFGSQGAGAGQVSSPQGVGVNDANGNVYVADTGNARVDEFSSSGAFIRAWGWGVTDGASSFETCTTTCQAGVSGSGAGQFTTPTFIAVDNSAGATAGDVYVGDTGHNLVTKFTAAGALVGAWGSGGQLNGSTATNGPFGSLAGITIDSSGNLWVYDQNSSMFEFAQDGTFSQEWNSGRGVTSGGIDADSAGNLYVITGGGSVEQFTSTGTDVGPVNGDVSSPTGFALDRSDNSMYMDNGGALIYHYRSSCDAAGSCNASDTFGSEHLTNAAGLAVDSSTGTVYAADAGDQRVDVFTPATLPDVSTGTASNVGNTTATLNGTVNPDSTTITDCHFDYVDDANYNPSAANPYAAGGTAACASTPSGSSPVAVSGAASGLSPLALYHFRVVAGNSSGSSVGSDQTFLTPEQPAVDGESVSAVGTGTATLNAQINPNDGDTTYHFEYGSAGACSSHPCTSIPVPDADIGSGATDAPAAQQLTGLSPGTTYHYRVVATNSVATTDGTDQTFTTFASPPPLGSCSNDQFRSGYGARLPDCRAYEQVTPVDKNGESIVDYQELTEASSTGNSVAFVQSAGLPGTLNEQAFPEYLASRGSTAWSTQSLLPPLSYGQTDAVLGWTSDLSQVFDLASNAGENAFLVRNSSDGSIDTAVPYTHVPYYPDGASADGSTVFFEALGQLTSNAATGQFNLYAWSRTTGTVSLVGVAPDGSTPAGGSFAGPYDWWNGNTNAGGANSTQGGYLLQQENAISTDGSRVYFTAGGSGQLYLRENPTGPSAATVDISASQKTNGTGPGGTDPNGPQPAAFMHATPDGSQVFFTSCEQLTNDSTATSPSPGSGCYGNGNPGFDIAGASSDLYHFDVSTGKLTDLTVDTSDPAGAQVRGVLGASDDGSHVYFAANGILAPGASSSAGSANIYLWHSGAISFIASVQGLDNWVPSPGATTAGTYQTSRVSPDGQALLFAASESLTGYHNVNPCPNDGTGSAQARPCVELYRYSAPNAQFNCVSCDPTGASPTGDAHLKFDYIPTQAFVVPAAPSVFLARNLSSDGQRVFFDSPDPLVPRAVNGVMNPYEWEANGTGSCRSTADNGGCLYLLSTGTSPDPSYFVDASASGDDAFILSDQPLVGQDQDQLADIYDVRVGGGLASQWPVQSTPCATSDGCHSAPPPPASLPSAATVTFLGPGNATSGVASPARVKVTRKTVKGGALELSVKVPGRGRITVTGAGLNRATKSVARAGTYKLRLTLTAKAKRTLKQKRKLRLTIHVRYVPTDGAASSATLPLTVKGK